MNRFRYNYDVFTAGMRLAQLKINGRVSVEKLERIKQRRFARLIERARRRSPFYKDLYRNIRDCHDLKQIERLPVVTKSEIMDNFDDVLTDRTVTKQTVLAFAEDPSCVGETLQGKYFVARTSGTTGNVGHYLHDLSSYFTCYLLSAARGVKEPRRHDTQRTLIPRRLRIASVLSPAANLGVASVIAAAPKMAKGLVALRIFDILSSADDTIASLNRFQPDVLGSFPTILEQLAEFQRSGRLRVRPRSIASGGEMLLPGMRQRLTETFRCKVYDQYGCAESGWLGMECRERDGIHVFSDWMILEPVDANNRPVPPGTESDKVLLTNLANHILPFIRFELPDRITVIDEPCSCGSRLPRIRVKGRSSEVLHFTDDHGLPKVIPPFHLTTLAEMVPGIEKFQIIQEDVNHLVVLFRAREGASPLNVGESLRASFQQYLTTQDLRSTISLVVRETEALHVDPSGKTRQVVCLQDRRPKSVGEREGATNGSKS